MFKRADELADQWLLGNKKAVLGEIQTYDQESRRLLKVGIYKALNDYRDSQTAYLKAIANL